jgi:hypothetical protein
LRDVVWEGKVRVMATTPSTAVLFGIDYRDGQGALARIQAADIATFQGGKSFVIEYIGGARAMREIG